MRTKKKGIFAPTICFWLVNIVVIALIAHKKLDNPYVVTAVLLFLMSVGIVYILNFKRMFRIYNDTIKEISSGHFDARIDTKHIYPKEFRELAQNINQMAEDINKFEEMRKDFIANTSHDFRSPLTSIRGFVQAILDGTIPVEYQEKYLRIVLDESDRLTRLTNDILLLSQMESDYITLEKVVFDIHDIIRKTFLQFEQKILQKKLNIILLIGKRELMVDADIGQIQRVLYNIIDNSIKFTDNGGEITISTKIQKDKVEVSISDNGIGISEANIKYIWDRFHKVDKSRGKDKKGIGLGLSIVREIIKAHGEQIQVYSQEGKGTTFVFTLPLCQKE